MSSKRNFRSDQSKVRQDLYLENVTCLFYFCQKLIEYGAYFELSHYIPSLTTELLFKLRESAWNWGDFNCFRVLHGVLHLEDICYIHLLNKNYYPVAIRLIMDLGLNILELSSATIGRVLSSIFFSEDDELLSLFFKNWDQQLQSLHQSRVVEQGNPITGTLLQKNKLIGRNALFKLMHWLVCHKLLNDIQPTLNGKKTLLAIAHLCHSPSLVQVLLKLGASNVQPAVEPIINESRHIRQSYQPLLSLHVCQSHPPLLNARVLISEIPAVVRKMSAEGRTGR